MGEGQRTPGLASFSSGKRPQSACNANAWHLPPIHHRLKYRWNLSCFRVMVRANFCNLHREDIFLFLSLLSGLKAR